MIVTIAIRALLGLGVAACLITVLGLWLAPDVYQRLHYVAIAGTIGVAAIVAAIVVRESVSQIGIKAILTGLALIFMNPVLTHATARATRIRRDGQWPAKPEEHVPIVRGEGKL